ncbi:MAG: right-handed parallel beta-helix repeat-containing protein [Bacteroidota bacterium]
MKKVRLHKALAFAIILIAGMSNSFGQALSGTYTIGGSTPNYATFTTAVNALVTNGVSGPVVFQVRNGTYNEQISIGAVSGVSATNTVTFQSQTGDSTAVILTYHPTSAANYTLRLNGCDHLIFSKISVNAIGNTYATAVLMENASTNNLIKNCVLNGNTTATTAARMAVVNSSANTNISNTILNCKINNGSYGIYYNGSSTTGIILEKNILTDQYYRAISVSYLTSGIIRANKVRTNSAYANFIGISLYNCDQNTQVVRNDINYSNGDYGIYMNACNGTSSVRGLVANNFISVQGTSSGLGHAIGFENSNYQNIYFNSINISRSSSSSACIYQKGNSGSSYFEVRDNIFSVNGGFMMFFEQYNVLTKSNYNDFVTSGSYYCYWNGGYYYSLSQWKSTSNMDTNTVSINPYFISATDLHVTQSLLNNTGTPCAGVSDDIDGQNRNATQPDLGADEWTPAANDAGITSIYPPCDGLDSVFVTLKNFGGTNLTNCKIDWTVNGVAQAQFSWTGNLTPNTSTGSVNIGYYNFTAGTSYTVIAWPTLPNGGVDPFNPNDTMKVLNVNAGMSGIYTVGGTTPNYSTINDALNAIYTYGICGPVTFNLRNGTYNSQVYISNINGTSAVNTVTFQSESGDSTQVILAGGDYPGFVYLNGGNYINFKKITIKNTSSYSAVYINSNSTNISISNCILDGYPYTTSTQAALINIPGSSTNLTFSRNVFKNGSYGIYWSGSNNTGLLIQNNRFESQYYRGIGLSSLKAPVVTGNFFTSTTNSQSDYMAINMSYCIENMRIDKNVITMPYYGYYAIQLNYCYGTSALHGLTANNFVSMTGTYFSEGYGINSYGSTWQDIVFNNVNIKRATSSSSRAFFQNAGGSDVRLYNNIFKAISGYASYISETYAISAMDYNDYYCPNGIVGYWNGNRTALSDWQSASVKDSNSFNLNPAFTTDTNLHVQQTLLDNKGKVFSGITTDIDGQTRSVSTPDIGADEFTTPASDAGLTTIDAGLTFCPGNSNVYVKLKNYGTSTLTSATIVWSVNAVAQVSYSWTGSLASGATTSSFAIGTYSFVQGVPYTIKAASANPNGVTDPFIWNDSAQILNKYVSMNGLYTIGGTTPDYATFNLAVADLNQRGVCGPVTFDVRAGSYNEWVNLQSIQGASSTNTITFKSEANDSTAVTLTYGSSASYTLWMNGCKYVTFKKMTIQNTYTYSRVIQFDAGASNNSITNCILLGVNSGYTSWDGSVIASNNVNNTNNTISDNIFRYGSYGIYYIGNSSPGASGVVIKNNTFNDPYMYAIYANWLPGIQIKNNVVNSTYSYYYFIGFYLDNCSNNIAITGNTIDMSYYGQYGMQFYYCYGNTSQRGLIANNFISLRGNNIGQGTGIYDYDSRYHDYFNNNINVLRSDGNNKAFYQTSGTDLRFIDNIFVSKYGYALYIDNPSAIAGSNYNDLFSDYGNCGYWYGGRTSITDWKNASARDTNSLGVNPYYISDANLHVQQPLLNNVGRPLPQITVDIDGQTRSLTTPDIGADEWNIPPNDAGIYSISQSLTLCHGADSVYVVIKNYGATTLTNVTVNWTVNSVAQTPFSWTGSVAPNTTSAAFSVGYYPFLIGTQYTIVASTSNPNGQPDPALFNDQAQMTNQYVSLSGNYIIGGPNPDFASFNLAVSALMTYGVCGPVVFDVWNGTYNESPYLGNVTGVSSTNTITFRSLSADSTQVILNGNNAFTLYATAPLYIYFQKMTLKSTGNTALYVYNGSTNVSVTNCIIEAPNNNSSSSSYSGIYMQSIPSTTSFITIKNNVFKYGSFSIYFGGSTVPGLEISNNRFTNPYYRGIYITGATAPQIKNNYIQTSGSLYSDYYHIDMSSCTNAVIKNNYLENNSSNNTFYAIYANSCDRIEITENTIINNYTGLYSFRGIYVYYCPNDIKVTRNKIKMFSGYYGIYSEGCTGTSTARGLFANNLVSLPGTYPGDAYGIILSSNNYQDVYYNSVNIPNRTSGSTKAFYQAGGGGNLRIKDNIFSAAYGTAYYIESGTTLAYSNYNDFNCPNGYMAAWNGTQYNTLATWHNVTQRDSSSSKIDPRYVADTNLHLQEPLLDNTGNPIAGLTTDYFNTARNGSHPDVGAIEWTAPPIDAGIQAIDDVASFCITSDSVYVTLKNYGSVNLTSATLNWKVNGVAQTPFNWTGNLAQGQTYGPFSIGFYNFSIATLYSVYAWTSNPNSGTDAYAFNDSSKVLNKYLAMSGTYTIGGTNPDFATFSLASSALTSSGVCGPVVFDVRPGTYYESVTVNTINGTSSTYTVTFQAANGDSTSVVLAYSGPPLYFQGCNYVTFKKLTLRNTASSGYVVYLGNNSSNDALRSCIIEGYTGNSTSPNEALVYAPGITASNNFTIDKNKMRYGSYALYVSGSYPLLGWTVSNNSMSGHYYRGIFENNMYSSRILNNSISVSNGYAYGVEINYCPSVEINGNSINVTGGSYTHGIYMQYCDNNIKIINNKIIANAACLSQYYCNGTATLRGVIANNFLMMPYGGSSPNTTIMCYNNNYQDYLYNSTNMIMGSQNSYAFYQQANGTNLRLKNNSFVTTYGYPIYINEPTSISESDYNNIYSSNGYFAGYWNGNRINLAYWQSASGQDAHSISVAPAYLSSTDLHTCNNLLNGAAVHLTAVTADIDGQPRDPSTPDIGADEFSGSSLNPGTISGNTTVCSGLTGISYAITPIPGASSYTWTVPSGWTITSGQGSSSILVSTGSNSGSICVFATNSCGTGSTSCLSVNNTGSISPGAVSGTAVVCGNQAGLVYSISSVSGATAYNWTVPSGWSITSGQNTTSLTVTSGANSGNICVTVTSGCGTSSPSCMAITVSNNVGTPSSISGSSIVCSSDTGLVYTITSQPDAVSYTWSVPIGWTITQGQGTVSIKVNASLASGNICVIANSSCGVQSLQSCTGITVNNGVATPGSISGSASVCSNLAGIAYSISPVSGAISYTWSVPTGWSITSGQGTNAIIVTSGTLGGNICVTAVNNCGVTSGASCANVSIISSMPPPGTIAGLSGVCPSQSGLTYSVNTIQGAVSYTWTVPTGWTITGGQGTNNIVVTSGTSNGTICVTATNSCNLTSTSSCLNVNITTTFPAPASITGNSIVCLSQQGITYTAATVPGAASYNWTVPTGWIITSGQGTTDITVTSGTTGGNICVTASNACGIISTATCMVVSINTNMQAPGGIIGSASVCPSMAGLSYSITPVSGAVSYAWVVPTGWTINSGQGTTAINVTSGTAGGSICVTATNSCGTTSVSSCFSISINSTVAIPGTISGNASVCSGLAGEVYSVQPVNGAVSYTWSTPTGWTITSGQGSNTITVTSGSVGGSICVSAVNVCGSSSSNSCLPVSITTTMQAPGAITGLTGVCPNQPLLTYSVTAVPGASSYTWTVPTGWTIAAGQGTNSITVTSGSTNGAICVTATNACNITSSATCINVNISSTFPAPSSIIGNNFVCQNTQGLYYSVTPVPGAVSYTWSTPSGYIITGGQGTDNIVLTSGTSGGNLCVTATNACGITSVATCLAISINSGMQSPGTITGVSTVCSNQTGLTYSVVPVSGAASYTWTLPNGWIILSGQGTASITATSGVSGGSLCVTATNACGITSVASCQAVSINSTIPTPGTITGIASVCPNLAGLVYSIQPVAGAVSYTWTVPTGWTISSGQGTSTISVASGSGNGNLCVTATNSCGVTSSSSCLPVSIATSMQAPAAITGLAAVCQGQAGISYSVTPVPGAVSYSWNVPSGWVINSGQGTDNINVTAGNSNGSICVNATNSCNLTSQPTCLTVSINTSMQSPGLISGVASVCPSQSGLIYAITPVAGATLYTWTLPTGWIINSGQGTDNINVTAGSGSGSVCVTATNTCNNTSAPSCLSVSSNSSVSAPGTISGNPGVCPGQTGLNYSILPVTGASSYNWTFPTGWIITSGQGTTTVSVIAGSASGSICVTALNSCGLTSTASCTSVTVSNSLAAPGTITGNDSVCGGNSGLTYSIAPVSGASTYNWTLPSGWAITAGAGTTTINVTSGTISGSICVTAGNGCSVSTASCRNVVVKAVVGTPLSISGNSNICGGNTGLAYSISPVANATAYSWTVPNGWTITSGQGSASIMVNAGTNPGTICVVASNACSSSSAACIPVTVGQAPAQPTAVYGPDSICPNTTGQVFYTNNVSGASSYFWSFPAGCVIVSGQGTTMVTVDMGAVGGTISVVASNSCGNSAAATHAIGLYPVPAIPVISVSGNNLISTSAYAYQWQLNGSEIPGAVLQAIAPSGSGFYNVTVYNSFGCSATSAPFSYNASGVDEVTTDASGMNVYPNPVHTMLTLTADFAQEQTFSVRLMNVLGELVNVIDDNYTGTAYSRTVNMEQLPSGVYYIILSTKDKNIYTKVVKN